MLLLHVLSIPFETHLNGVQMLKVMTVSLNSQIVRTVYLFEISSCISTLSSLKSGKGKHCFPDVPTSSLSHAIPFLPDVPYFLVYK